MISRAWELASLCSVLVAFGCDEEKPAATPEDSDAAACVYEATDAGGFVVDLSDAGPAPDAAADAAPLADAGPPSDAALSDAAIPDVRVTEGLVLLYTFEEGQGAVVHDVSGVAPALDLTAADPEAIAWGSGALRIAESTIFESPVPATKVIEACAESGSLSLEAWVRPESTEQSGPARILTLSKDSGERNFTLGQVNSQVNVRVRASQTSENGTPSLSSPYCSFLPRLTHVVYSFDENGVVRMFMDGEVVTSATIGGGLESWDETMSMAIGNEYIDDRTWLGDLHLVAVYCQALSRDEVLTNMRVGP